MRPGVLLLGAVSLFVVAWYATAPRPPAIVAAAAQTAPAAPVQLTTSREQWAYDLALALGNPAPDAATVALIVAWTRAEDGDDSGALARHNPLNTTETAGAVATVNSHGVKAYGAREDGIAATVQTLSYSYPGYSEIAAGLATNDPERALAGLHASPWGTSAGLVETIYRETAPPPVAVEAAPLVAFSAPAGAAVSSPLSLAGDCGHNVRVALDANGGALWQVTIPPGATWSFNATMGNPAAVPYVSAFGVPGGCWCDLAARYAVVGAQLGLVPTFEHHGIQLNGVPWEYSVAIWNTGGGAGSAGAAQDLELTNPTDRPIVLTARENGGAVTIEGGVLR